MKKAFFALLFAALFLSGCAAPAGYTPAPVADRTAAAPETPLLPAITPAAPPMPSPRATPDILRIEGAYSLTALCDTAYVADKAGSYKLADGIFVENSRSFAADGTAVEAFRLFLGDAEALTYDLTCDAGFGFCDLTGDGREEVVLFLHPSMSNFVSGDLHVFDLGGTPKEILYFRAEPTFGDAPETHLAGEEACLALPASFGASANVSTEDPGLYYSRALCDVSVLADTNGLFFLRLTNDANEYETAYTFLVWDGGWRVAAQELMPK